MDLARSRVLQDPLGNLHPGVLLVLAPLRHRGLVFVGGEVPLYAIEARAAEGKRGQGGADSVADGQRGEVLAFGVGGDDQVLEPLAEAAVLEDRTAEGQRLLLAPLVDPPTASDPVAEDIVEAEALELGADVALVGFLSVIGVLVAAPVVYIIKIVGHVPLAQGGDQRIETLDPHLRGGAALAARSSRLDAGGHDGQDQQSATPDRNFAHNNPPLGEIRVRISKSVAGARSAYYLRISAVRRYWRRCSAAQKIYI